MDTLALIRANFDVGFDQRRMPIEIPNFGRTQLAGLFELLGFRVGVEVGTEEGVYAETLCQANPRLRLYCVDPWQRYAGYRDHVSQEKLDGFYEATKKRLAPHNVELVREFSPQAADRFEGRSLDFVYIDGNHRLEQVVADIAAWLPKVRPGGIISGHDYRKSRSDYPGHVVQAVNAWTDAYRVRPWFVLGRKAKIRGEIRDGQRSWMWVVE